VIEESPFAPEADTIYYRHLGSLLPSVFAVAYRNHLRRLWRAAPDLFLGLIDAARAGDVTVVDEWPDDDHAPRRVLAAALKWVARWRGSRLSTAPPGPRRP